MYVETWVDFRRVLRDIAPGLSPADAATRKHIDRWALNNAGKYFSILSNEITEVENWIDSIRLQFTGQSFDDLGKCIAFLMSLNVTMNVSFYHTIDGCIRRGGYYWYDNACHTEAEPPPPPPPPPEPPPEPPPPPPEMPPILTGIGAMAEQVAAYCETIPVTKIVEKGVCITIRNWLRVIAGFQEWLGKRS